MKKIFLLTLLIGLLAVNLSFLPETDSVIGATKDVSLGAMQSTGIKTNIPPWLNVAWHYRRPVVIHSGVALAKYQVLITLNNTNFASFAQTKPDGSDIRLTNSDGITELSYWIESWNSAAQVAYVWVLLEPLNMGDTTLYLYYNNPSAPSTSNGGTTFNLFDDDWTEFSPAQLNVENDLQGISSNNDISNLSWYKVGTPAVIPPGILALEDGDGIQSVSSYLYQAVGIRANFGLGTGRESGGFIVGEGGPRLILGDKTSDVDGMYLTNSISDTVVSTPFEPMDNWHNTYHVFEVRWKNGQGLGRIDHGVASAESINRVPSSYLPVTFFSYPESGATLLVDWVYVRQYTDPEPTASVGAEQGLVDLSISMSDSPDPIQKEKELTYLLTISNNSSINAPGVVVTDTIPTDKVIFVRSIPPSCSYFAPNVICSLGSIGSNSNTSVSIVVTPFVDGLVINTANVDSPSYDLNMINNSGTTNTLVDTVPPNVNWIKPVMSGQKYSTNGGLVELEASAADNDQIAWVEFWYWDHLGDPPAPVPIGKDFTYPYQYQINSNNLATNSEYQVFAQASDRAGNVTDIHTPPFPVIYITRISVNYIFLPITRK